MTTAQADLSNWRQSPHNEWAFRNVDKLIAAHTIKASSEAVKLEIEPRNLKGFSTKTSDDSTVDLKSWLSWSNTDGFLVLHHGKIVYEHYDHGNDASSKHIMMSMTKSVTGLITGVLASRGKIDLQAPVKKYVPEASSIYDGVTVRHCLDMQTGVVYDDNSHEYRRVFGWEPLDGSEKFKTAHGFLESVEAKKVEPDTFNYCSVNTDLLGWALERASGKKLAELIQEYVWQPAGAESDALITVDSEGSGRAAGGMCATVRDIARIGQMLAERKDAIPASWINDMLENGDQEAYAAGAFAPITKAVLETASYRDCWVTDKQSKTLCALGIFGQQLMVDMGSGLVMAKTASQPDPISPAKIVANMAAFEELKRVLLS